jgi:CheY-like chemotaxis protein
MHDTTQAHPALDVLIAEDDVITRRTLRRLLENEGYACAEADDGREAVEIAKQSPPRLALLDVMMPVMDGFTAAQLLRADPRTRNVHIHFLTARDDVDARRAARHAGGEGLLTKPVDFDGLLDAVSIVLLCDRDSRTVKTE